MRVLALFCAVSLLQVGILPAFADPGSPPSNLNLSSTVKSVPASSLGIDSNMAIVVGGTRMTVSPGSLLTPAEYVAATQVLASGRQTVTLGAGGNAVGGRFALAPTQTTALNNLVIPGGVTMLQNFAVSQVLNLSGDLVNSGKILAYTTQQVGEANLAASNIFNQSSGLITTVLGTRGFGTLASSAVKDLSLGLDAKYVLSNAGTISSANNLRLSGGSSVANLAGAVAEAHSGLNVIADKVTNAGTLSAGGNLNFANARSGNVNLNVDNTGGKMQSIAGNINFRDTSYADKGNINLVGGTASAANLNFNAGCGTVRVDVDQIDGLVNMTGGATNVTTHGGDLQLGSIELSGDPAFYNTAGSISITTDLNFHGQNLAIVASRNISMSGSHVIDTSATAADTAGGTITLIAGAKFTANGGTGGAAVPGSGTVDGTTVSSPNTDTTLKISGPSIAGGGILLSSATAVTSEGNGNGAGGDITMIAYKGTQGFSGDINLTNADVSSGAGSGGSGNNGSITVLGGNDVNIAGNNKTIDTTGGSGGAGSLLVQKGNAVIVGAITADYLDGAHVGGTGTFVPSPKISTGTMTVGNVLTGNGSVTLKNGSSITTGNITSPGGAVDIEVYGGSQSLNFSNKTYQAASVDLYMQNGGMNATNADILTSGNTTIRTASASLDDITVSGNGDVSITMTGSGNLGDITTGSGRIRLVGSSSITTANLRTTGGNIYVDAAGALGTGYVVASNGAANYGQVYLKGDTINVNGSLGIATPLSGNPKSLVGSSVFLYTTGSGGGFIRPTTNGAELTWSTANRLTISNLVYQNNFVNFNQSIGSDLDISGTSFGAAQDYIAISDKNVTSSAPMFIDTSAGSGPGGQILILAGAQFATPTNFLLVTGPSATGGSVQLGVAGFTSLQTNGGANVIVGSYSTSTNQATVSIGDITSLDGGFAWIYNAFPGGSSGTTELYGNINTSGDAQYAHGGTVLVEAGNLVSFKGSVLDLISNGTGSGNGGTVTVKLYDQTSALNIDNAAGKFELLAQSGGAGGNGGTASVTAVNHGFTLNVNPSRVDVRPLGSDGNGGNISFFNMGNSTTISGTGTLNANGVGIGNGGSIAITSSGGNALTIANDLRADGGTSGGLGGSITLSSGASMLFNTGASLLTIRARGFNNGGSGGTISISNTGPISMAGTSFVQLDASGSGYGNGGTITVNASSNSNAVSIGQDAGEFHLLATGGSGGFYAGDGGTVSFTNGGDLNVDAPYLNVRSQVAGNGGNISLISTTGTISIFSTIGLTPLEASADPSWYGNGGNIFISVQNQNASPIQISTDIKADGGGVYGDGGNISIIGPGFSIDGLELAGTPTPEIDFAANKSLTANATVGNGGSITLWGLNYVSPTAITVSANAGTNWAVSAGGVDVVGGSIMLISSGADGTINIGNNPNSFVVAAAANSSGAGTRADGGTVQLFARGGADINVNTGSINVKPTGVKGAGGTLNMATILNGPHHDFTGGFQMEDYGGTINLFGSGLDLTGLNLSGGDVIFEVNSLKPISITTNIDASGSGGTGGTIYISNFAPGGVSIAGGVTIRTNDTVNNDTGGRINISTSHLDLGTGAAVTLESLGGPNNGGGSQGIIVVTTDPLPLLVDNVAGGLVITSRGGNAATMGGSIIVSSGGDLTVDATALDVGPGVLQLSAGLVPAGYFEPFVNGAPPLYAGAVPADANFLSGRSGNLSIDGNLNLPGTGVTGGRVTLLSNSSTPFVVGSAGTNAIDGAITVTGSQMGAVAIANFGSGGVSVPTLSDITIEGGGSGGSALTVTTNPAEGALPVTMTNASGVLVLYAPHGLLSLGSGTISLRGDVGNTGSNVGGGTIYLRGDAINVAGGTLALNASANKGRGGSVYVLTNTGDINIGATGTNPITIDNRAATAGLDNANMGSVTVIAGGSLTVDVANMQTALPAGHNGNGPAFDLGALNGTMLITGNLLANGVGTGSAGSINLTVNDPSSFVISGATTNGITGNLQANNGPATSFGNITINGVGTSDLTVVLNISLSTFGSTTGLTLNTQGGDLTLSVASGATLSGTVNGASAQNLTINDSNTNGLTVGSLTAYDGSIDVSLAGGTLLINNNAKVLAENGTLTIQNQSLTGNISIGTSALLSASSPTVNGADVTIFVGATPTPGTTHTLTNVTVNTTSPGDAFFNNQGAGAITAGVSTVNAEQSNVVINNQGSGNITIGGGAKIQGVTLASFDLSNATTATYIKQLQTHGVLTGSLTLTGGIATGGSVTVPQQINRNYSAFVIPTFVTAQFNDLNDLSPIKVNLITAPATINGRLNFGSTGGTPNATMIVTGAPVTGNMLVIDGSGGFAQGQVRNVSNGNITINVAGNIQMTDALIDTSASAGGDIIVATTANNGSLSIDGTISATTVGIVLNGTGALSQTPSSEIQASAVSIFAGGDIGSSNIPITLVYNGNSGRWFYVDANTGGDVYLFASGDAFASIGLTGISGGTIQLDTGDSGYSQVSGFVAGSSINMASGHSFVGTATNPLRVITPEFLASAVEFVGLVDNFSGATNANALANSGIDIVTEGDTTTGLMSTASGDIKITTDQSLIANSMSTVTGDIVLTASNSISVNPSSIISTTGGNISMSVASSTGTVTIGHDAILLALNTSAAPTILLSVGGAQGTTVGSATNITTHTNSGGLIYLNTIAGANPPMNDIYATGAGTTVTLDQGASGTVFLDGSVRIIAGDLAPSALYVTSLDLDDAPTVASIVTQQNAGLLGGTLTLTGGVATGGNVIVSPFNLNSALTAVNVPSNVTASFTGFSSNNLVAVSLTGGSTTPSVQIDGTTNFVGAGGFNIQSSLLVNGVDLSGTLSAGTDLAVISNRPINFISGSLMLGDTVTLSGQSGGSLTVSGTGSITGLRGIEMIAPTGSVNFTGATLQLAGPVFVSAPTSVIVDVASAITANSVFQVNSPTLSASLADIIANQIVLNAPSALSAGTIVNPNGDVVLPTNMVFQGKNLSIIASGNILAKTGVTSINLSSLVTANGGILTMIAGYDFTLQGGGAATASNTPLSGTNYTITGASESGGSILLPAVNINLKNVNATGSFVDAGSLLAVAHGGTTNAGLVSLGTITATATKAGHGGFINIIADGGIRTKSIDNSGGFANTISMQSSTPAILNGPISITGGTLTGAGIFVGSDNAFQPGASGIVVTGTIKSAASAGYGGYVTLGAQGPINVSGAITATGSATPTGGTIAGGLVSINAATGNITTAGINVSALNVASATNAAGGGGSILLLGQNLLIKGALLANGGTNTAGTGGSGGFVSAAGSSTGGVIKVTGAVSAAGGNGKITVAGVGGLGGQVGLVASVVQVMSTIGGVSINAAGGKGVTPGGDGGVNISTNDTQPLFANFDLTSKLLAIPVLPGSVFSVGIGNPVNGVAGTILASVSQGAVTKANVNGANTNGFVIATNRSLNGFDLTIGGSSNILVSQNGPALSLDAMATPTARKFVTPSIGAAIFQQQHGYSAFEIDTTTGLAITGGGTTLTADQIELPTSFSKFKLPSPFSFAVTGLTPVLTLPSTALVQGMISFTTATNTAMIDFGSASPTIGAGPGTGISSNGNVLILTTKGGTINNKGDISANDLIFGRTTSGALTFNSIGSTASVDVNGAIVLSPSASPTFTLNIRDQGNTNFNAPVEFRSVPLGTSYGELATAYAKSANAKLPVKLTFAQFDNLGVAAPATVGGSYSAKSVSITTVKVTANNLPVLTPLIINSGANITSDSTATLTSVGSLTTGLTVTLGALKNVSLTATGIVLGDENTLYAGQLTSTAPLTGTVNTATDVLSSGILTLKATTNDVALGAFGALSATGGNVAMTSLLGDIGIGSNNVIRSNGARIVILAKLDVTGGDADQIVARSTSTATNTGGGIEIGGGLTTSSFLGAAFAKHPPFISGSAGITVPPDITGVFIVNTSGGGSVNLASPTASTVDFNKGAMVFDGMNGHTVNLSNVQFVTYAVKPVAGTEQQDNDEECVVDASLDEEQLDSLAMH